MHKPEKKEKCGVMGLVIAGLVSALVGLSLIIRPIPYMSSGGTGHYGSTPLMSVFYGNNSAYVGLIILFMGCFILAVAYKVKNP